MGIQREEVAIPFLSMARECRSQLIEQDLKYLDDVVGDHQRDMHPRGGTAVVPKPLGFRQSYGIDAFQKPLYQLEHPTDIDWPPVPRTIYPVRGAA